MHCTTVRTARKKYFPIRPTVRSSCIVRAGQMFRCGWFQDPLRVSAFLLVHEGGSKCHHGRFLGLSFYRRVLPRGRPQCSALHTYVVSAYRMHAAMHCTHVFGDSHLLVCTLYQHICKSFMELRTNLLPATQCYVSHSIFHYCQEDRF
jgi:hypothetical protein